ncbi:response regulator [Plesiocystis pacifica SIR-1]|uniref:Response regulator n=1 Tax=Plesiocystis pacifica SIR-1 TaxID=391625 RepID=A6GCN6_9BACT|nr:response regulator [Plesiocystis pacifica]EDM76388.1 response regulator [Plesiocystis pacifica SIR-1]
MATINSILLVDDEPDIRTIAEMSLSHVGGWKTHIATCGAEALTLAEQHTPDVIVLDVMMPEMDGVSTFKALAGKEATRGIPVIFMTAKIQPHEREHYVGLGAAGVIAKPFDPMQLPTEIQKILAQPAQTRGRNRMDALRQRYAERLGEKLGGLQAALEAARAATPEGREQAYDAAHRIAHTLHGTAGTYGHQEVSELMASIELTLESLARAAEPATEADAWAEIERCMAAAGRIAE